MDCEDCAKGSIRSAIPEDVKVIDERLEYDEVVKFVRKGNYDKTPLILNVEGRKVAMNFISTRERLCNYLRIQRNLLASHLSNLSKTNLEPKILRFSECNLKSRKISLGDLPILKYYPSDGGKYITAGVVIARFPEKSKDSESCNACIHRMMVLDEKRLVIRLVKPRHTYLLWENAIKRGRDLEIAIAIGVHPLVLFASATRLPEGMEFKYAKALMGDLTLYKSDSGLLIPPAEIVMFGRITDKLADEGPFVDLTGTYDIIRKQPVVEIDEIYTTEEPIYYSITPASSEHQVLMGIPYEPVIYESVAKVCKVKNVAMSEGGMHYFHAFVQIEKHSEGDAKNAILAAFAAHHSLKHVVVVDDDIDIFNPLDVEYALATRFQGDKDLVIIKGARGSSLDPSSNNGLTTKIGFDATKLLERKKDFDRIL